jgi:hypothetical protein
MAIDRYGEASKAHSREPQCRASLAAFTLARNWRCDNGNVYPEKLPTSLPSTPFAQ